jgi:hypothetical protein
MEAHGIALLSKSGRSYVMTEGMMKADTAQANFVLYLYLFLLTL